MEIVDNKFVITKTINNSLKCELLSYPKWIKFLGRKEFKDKSTIRKDVRIVKFYFLAKKGGLANFEFNSIHVYANGIENKRENTTAILRTDKVLVLPGNELRLKVLPVLTETVSKVITCRGKVVNRTNTVSSYGGIEINYQKFQPIPHDFSELINELCGSSGFNVYDHVYDHGLKIYEPKRTQLIESGLLHESYAFGDSATELLRKNKDLILTAIAKVEKKSTCSI